MAVAKIVEITSSSTKSFDDAIKTGLARAAKTLEGITGAWVEEQKVVVKEGQIKEYRVDMRVNFILHE
ncbi:MAG: dodecin domain-containing protein [Deltaproteobacteria bacterium]|nr:dodecin domain-containing protein [Deltaproteobacteria bacterium]NIS77226.1 dodecin domain-containing protein [Deltaproteobacteria bacterium]